MSRYIKRRTKLLRKQVYDSDAGLWIYLSATSMTDSDYNDLPTDTGDSESSFSSASSESYSDSDYSSHSDSGGGGDSYGGSDSGGD